MFTTDTRMLEVKHWCFGGYLARRWALWSLRKKWLTLGVRPIGSVFGLAGPVSVYWEWVRWQV